MIGVHRLQVFAAGWLALASREGVGVAVQATENHALTGVDYSVMGGDLIENDF